MWKNIIDEDLIVINPDISSKEELFTGMVDHVYEHDYIINKKKFLSALNKREKISNTELISGVALPHARSNIVEKMFLSIIILKNGLEYDNPDMGKVNIIFFFGCTESQNKEYLQLLAKSSRLLKNEDFRNNLIEATTKEEIINLLMKYDDEDKSAEKNGHHLLILTLHDTNKIPEVLEAMIEVGITNSSIVDSVSMARKMAYEMPVFAGLSYMAQGKSSSSSLIFAHIEKRNQAEQLARLLKDYKIDFNKKGVGFIQVIKLENVIGSFEEDIDI